VNMFRCTKQFASSSVQRKEYVNCTDAGSTDQAVGVLPDVVPTTARLGRDTRSTPWPPAPPLPSPSEPTEPCGLPLLLAVGIWVGLVADDILRQRIGDDMVCIIRAMTRGRVADTGTGEIESDNEILARPVRSGGVVNLYTSTFPSEHSSAGAVSSKGCSARPCTRDVLLSLHDRQGWSERGDDQQNAVCKEPDPTRHDTTRHDTTRHNTTQHNTTQHNTTQHNTTQHNTTQHNTTTPHHITPHNTTQHNTTRTCGE
jgi:hypothetical protein